MLCRSKSKCVTDTKAHKPVIIAVAVIRCCEVDIFCRHQSTLYFSESAEDITVILRPAEHGDIGLTGMTDDSYRDDAFTHCFVINNFVRIVAFPLFFCVDDGSVQHEREIFKITLLQVCKDICEAVFQRYMPAFGGDFLISGVYQEEIPYECITYGNRHLK